MEENHSSTRRGFIGAAAASVGYLYLTSLTPRMLAQAHQHAMEAAKSSAPVAFRFFDAATAAEVEAIAEQIIPSDDSPGAREANVVHFIDYVLTEFEPQNKDKYTEGIANIRAMAAEVVPGTKSFAELPKDKQLELLKELESAPPAAGGPLRQSRRRRSPVFFEMIRTHVIAGFLCDPSLGGNKDQVGWNLIGFDGKFFYDPPFGYYDAEAMKEKA